jgi:hypothetical protein
VFLPERIRTLRCTIRKPFRQWALRAGGSALSGVRGGRRRAGIVRPRRRARRTGRENGIRFLLCSGQPLREPVAWYGPIVMNTQEQPRKAFQELDQGTFLKQAARGQAFRLPPIGPGQAPRIFVLRYRRSDRAAKPACSSRSCTSGDRMWSACRNHSLLKPGAQLLGKRIGSIEDGVWHDSCFAERGFA